MLGTANVIPDLPVIPDTTNVIEEISRQSLQVASLIHEYTKLAYAGNPIWLLFDPFRFNDHLFIGRMVKIQIPGGLKLRIEECQESCATLKDKFYSRIHLDTNTQVKATLRQNSMFLPQWQCPLSGLFTADMGRKLKAIVNDQLGTFGFVFSLMINNH